MDRLTEFDSLRRASIAARGLWHDIEALTIMHSADGSLPVDRDRLARVAGVDRSQVDSLVTELAICGMLEVAADGTIFSDTLAAKVSIRKSKEKWAAAKRRRKERLIEAIRELPETLTR